MDIAWYKLGDCIQHCVYDCVSFASSTPDLLPSSTLADGSASTPCSLVSDAFASSSASSSSSSSSSSLSAPSPSPVSDSAFSPLSLPPFLLGITLKKAWPQSPHSSHLSMISTTWFVASTCRL